MEMPPSMVASSHRPRQPWEESLRAADHGASRFVSRPLLALLCFITLALTAGAFIDQGDGHQKQGGVSEQSGSEKGATQKRATPHIKKQRGKLLPAAEERKEGIAKDMYNVYRELEEEYHEKAFRPENEQKWKVLNEKDGVQVSLLEHESDPTCPYVRMEAVLPSSVQECWEFLSIPNWHITMPKMDPFYQDHEMYSNYTHKGVNMVLVRKRTHRIFAFGKRDFVFLSVSDKPMEDGTWVSGTVSVDTPDVPRQHGYTRAFQDSIAFYKAVEDPKTGQEQCHLTIVCRIDMNDSSVEGSGGFMPMWLYVKTIGTTGTKSVIRMRDALIEMKNKYKEKVGASMPTSVSSSRSSRPPSQSPVVEKDIRLAYQMHATNTSEINWWGRWRGGSSSSVFPPKLKWGPLYGVFAHCPPKQERQQTDPKIARLSWGVPVKMSWLHRLGNRQRRTSAM